MKDPRVHPSFQGRWKRRRRSWANPSAILQSAPEHRHNALADLTCNTGYRIRYCLIGQPHSLNRLIIDAGIHGLQGWGLQMQAHHLASRSEPRFAWVVIKLRSPKLLGPGIFRSHLNIAIIAAVLIDALMSIQWKQWLLCDQVRSAITEYQGRPTCAFSPGLCITDSWGPHVFKHVR